MANGDTAGVISTASRSRPLEKGIERTAVFSQDKKYRFHLGRYWDRTLPILGFLLTNPSKAGATSEDNTSTRAIERAKRLGFGGCEIVNAFAFIDTMPEGLRSAFNPIGSSNDDYILALCRDCAMVIAGWGQWGRLYMRDQKILKLLEPYKYVLHCLGTNRDGSPMHPLYLSYDIQPKIYRSFQ